MNREEFINSQLEGLKLDHCWDVHAHLLGVGDSESGIYIKSSNGLCKVKEFFRLAVFKHFTKSFKYPTDFSYLEYYSKCAENVFPGFKSLAFAFAHYHDNQGNPHHKLSDFHIPNSWSKYASQQSHGLLYVASIHPKAENAIEQLKQAKLDGAVAIKWLPCAHNINPSDRSLISFYEALRDLKLPLITHAGAEHAVQGDEFDQTFGNPLHLRLPLDCGAKVIIAHCATNGYDLDFENGNKKVPSFHLFSRLMNEKKYDGLLYADISATPQINRAKWLNILIENEHWHSKLLNGSDYPLPSIPILFSLRWLRIKGLISEHDLWHLNGIRKDNPLLFDFLLKKCMRYKGKKFSNEVFETRRVFDF